MNKVLIIGNIGADAEMKEYSGKPFVTFNVCAVEKYTDASGQKKETKTWFKCVHWKGMLMHPYLKKGVKVYIEGKPTASAFIKDGEAKGVLQVNVVFMELLSTPTKPESKPEEKPKEPHLLDEQFNPFNSDDMPF